MSAVKGGDTFLAAMEKISQTLGQPGVVRIGFLEGRTDPNTGQSLAERAALNEYGHMTNSKGGEGSYYVLPRPFFRNMIAEKKHEWPGAIATSLKKTGDIEKTLDEVGSGIAGQLKQSIDDLVSPPLAPSTIKAKGFSKPLIEHGDMRNAVDHEVVMK